MTTIVFLTSLLAIPISYFMNNLFSLREPLVILLVGVLCLLLVTLIPYFHIRKRPTNNTDPFYYALGIFTFSSVIDLIIALENDGIIDDFMEFYLREGEPYLRTSHGTMVCYWDGIAHYAMYLIMLAALSWNQSYREVGLYWAGSIIHSMLVFVPGSIIGKHGIKWVIFLNIPYIIIPVFVAVSLLQSRPKYKESIAEKEKKKTNWLSMLKDLIHRPVDALYIFYFLTAAFMALIRACAVLGSECSLFKSYLVHIEPYMADDTNYPKMQMLIYFFYFTPYYIWMTCLLLKRNSIQKSWVVDWATIHAGAAAQAQFCHIGSSLHYRTPYSLRVPQSPVYCSIFWIINLMLLVVPQFFMVYCRRQINPIVEVGDSDISKSLKAMGSQASLDAIDRLVETATKNKMIALHSK